MHVSIFSPVCITDLLVLPSLILYIIHMRVFWKYLKPYSWKIVLAMSLAGLAQVFALYDPVIFGKIVDDYALQHSGSQLPAGIIHLLLLAIAIALASLLFSSLKDYVLRMIVKRFGMDIFQRRTTAYLTFTFSGIRRPDQRRDLSCIA